MTANNGAMQPFQPPKPYSYNLSVHELRHWDIYLGEHIESQSEYQELFSIFATAGPDDSITLHLNNFGGDLYSAIQWCDAIRTTEAVVTVNIIGACMSAGSIIALAADQWRVSKHSVMMIHAARGGQGGTISEMKTQSDFDHKWVGKIMRDYYQHFLTEEEILEVEKGVTLWMDADEIGERLDRTIEGRKRDAGCEDKEAEEIPPPCHALTREEAKRMTKQQLIDHLFPEEG